MTKVFVLQKFLKFCRYAYDNKENLFLVKQIRLFSFSHKDFLTNADLNALM